MIDPLRTTEKVRQINRPEPGPSVGRIGPVVNLSATVSSLLVS